MKSFIRYNTSSYGTHVCLPNDKFVRFVVSKRTIHVMNLSCDRYGIRVILSLNHSWVNLNQNDEFQRKGVGSYVILVTKVSQIIDFSTDKLLKKGWKHDIIEFNT